MSIEGLRDEQKSALLGEAMGWRVDRRLDWDIVGADGSPHKYGVVLDKDGSELVQANLAYTPSPSFVVPSLYDPANMALAWRVLNWAALLDCGTDGFIAEKMDDFIADTRIIEESPDDAQRLFLDKILTLAIEAGIVEAQNEE